MRKIQLAFMVTILVASILACRASVDLFGKEATTPDPNGEPSTPLLPFEDDPVQQTISAISTGDASATSAAATQTAIPAQETQAMLMYAATETARSNDQSTPAGSIDPAATEQARLFEIEIQKLVEQGILEDAHGEFFRLDDYEKSWAQIGYYIWDDTGYKPEDFVISTQAKWSSASTTANWPQAGCGFVFAERDENNHLLAYLGLDGYAYLVAIRDGEWNTLTYQKAPGKISVPDGEARIMLVVSTNKIYFFVNDTEVTRATEARIDGGSLSFTLLSGTNKDFGTRCQLSDTQLWIIQ